MDEQPATSGVQRVVLLEPNMWQRQGQRAGDSMTMPGAGGSCAAGF